MKREEDICYLKKVFAERFSYATLTITTRKVKRTTYVYLQTVGCYKVDSRRLIECIIGDVEGVSGDLKTLTYKYKAKL